MTWYSKNQQKTKNRYCIATCTRRRRHFSIPQTFPRPRASKPAQRWSGTHRQPTCRTARPENLRHPLLAISLSMYTFRCIYIWRSYPVTAKQRKFTVQIRNNTPMTHLDFAKTSVILFVDIASVKRKKTPFPLMESGFHTGTIFHSVYGAVVKVKSTWVK